MITTNGTSGTTCMPASSTIHTTGTMQFEGPLLLTMLPGTLAQCSLEASRFASARWHALNKGGTPARHSLEG